MTNSADMDPVMLMHKVLIGSAKASETAELDAWIAEDPAHAQEFDDMKFLYSESWQVHSSEKVHDDSWNRIQRGISRIQARRRWMNLLAVLGMSLGICIVIILMGDVFLSETTKKTEQYQDRLAETVHFKSVYIGNIARSIEDAYGFRIIFGSSDVAYCAFTGTFRAGTSVKDLIEVLAKAGNLHIHYISDTAVELSGPGCVIP